MHAALGFTGEFHRRHSQRIIYIRVVIIEALRRDADEDRLWSILTPLMVYSRRTRAFLTSVLVRTTFRYRYKLYAETSSVTWLRLRHTYVPELLLIQAASAFNTSHSIDKEMCRQGRSPHTRSVLHISDFSRCSRRRIIEYS